MCFNFPASFCRCCLHHCYGNSDVMCSVTWLLRTCMRSTMLYYANKEEIKRLNTRGGGNEVP